MFAGGPTMVALGLEEKVIPPALAKPYGRATLITVKVESSG